ncbi:hypothetical protein HJC23_001303 [Cyclotella cryptica]|uniref:DNA primase large subunit C-terminal domain-containing protein n=1 Tax=Cyclotella cryptica TaxID=29204 RepID=A0ABD3P814_9STRA
MRNDGMVGANVFISGPKDEMTVEHTIFTLQGLPKLKSYHLYAHFLEEPSKIMIRRSVIFQLDHGDYHITCLNNQRQQHNASQHSATKQHSSYSTKMNVAGRPRGLVAVSPTTNSSGSSARAGVVDVDMYSDIPSFELSLDEFEEYALARLKVLRKIEELKTRNTPQEAFRSSLSQSLKTNLPTPKIDTASHFILRAAYCRSEDLRRWFLAQECKLFSFRLEQCKNIRDFMKRNDIDLEMVDKTEKERVREKLLSVPGAPSPLEFNSTEYYRVPFVEALRLVSSRECYLERGFAYVPLAKIISIVEAKFRSALSKSLVLAGNNSNNAAVDEHTRIGPLLKSMNSQYTGPSHVANIENGEALTAANVDASVRSMPLCMSQLHAGLKRDHKLKHQGRLQFGLFLKGAGMSMEEHTMFFQREFTKIMTGEQFNKQYSYSIRHMHGKEGKRASYTPYNCMKIVMGSPPGGGEHHGCPYKHYDEENLSALLGKLHVGSVAEREAILKLKRDGNAQLACAKHFEVVHPGASGVESVSLDGVGNHPNAWFTASRKYYEAKEGSGKSVKMEMEVVKQEG